MCVLRTSAKDKLMGKQLYCYCNTMLFKTVASAKEFYKKTD